MSPAELRARIAETRARQGLSPTITDPAVLQQLAARVADVLVQPKGDAGVTGQDHDGGRGRPGRRRPSRKTHTARQTESADGTS